METKFYSIAAVIVALVALVFAVPASQGQDQQENVISITGDSSVSANPDKANVVVSVETEALNASRSQAMNRDRSADVLAALRDMGIMDDQIQTTGYSIQRVPPPVRIGEDGREEDLYRVVNSIKVETDDIQAVGDVIDAAIESGANRIDSVEFDLTEENRERLKHQALQQASTAAAEKAMLLAERLNVTVGKAVQISESSFDFVPSRARSLEGTTAADTEIVPGEVEVTATVSVDYRIK